MKKASCSVLFEPEITLEKAWDLILTEVVPFSVFDRPSLSSYSGSDLKAGNIYSSGGHNSYQLRIEGIHELSSITYSIISSNGDVIQQVFDISIQETGNEVKLFVQLTDYQSSIFNYPYRNLKKYLGDPNQKKIGFGAAWIKLPLNRYTAKVAKE